MERKTEWVELYRAFIPRNKLLNDNAGQHYRIMEGKMNFLSAQFDAFENGDPTYNSIIGDFHIDDIPNIQELIGEDGIITIRNEVWRPNNIRFDPHNYSKTFKMPIDKLTKMNLMAKDDNWKFIDSSIYAGGGANAWERSYRYRNVLKDDEAKEVCDGYELMEDGLPREMNLNWWNEFSDDTGAIFIRVLIRKEEY